MKSIRFALAIVLCTTVSFVRPIWAASFSNDQSDLWWNPNENGWGIQFVQRGSTIFATMFVYDANGNPTWYTATMEGSRPNGVLTFTGDLYATTGSWFGAVPYLPAKLTLAKVGAMTWQKTSGDPGTLTYSVNGVNVTKSLTRQPIRNDDYTGPYIGGLHLVASGCTDPARNGPTNAGESLAITQNGATISLRLFEFGCTLSGTYSQNGQFGTASGNYTCTNGDLGTFDMSNMNVTPYAMAALVSTSSTISGCQSAGQIGGVRIDK
jgi:hypothetical protein